MALKQMAKKGASCRVALYAFRGSEQCNPSLKNAVGVERLLASNSPSRFSFCLVAMRGRLYPLLPKPEIGH